MARLRETLHILPQSWRMRVVNAGQQKLTNDKNDFEAAKEGRDADWQLSPCAQTSSSASAVTNFGALRDAGSDWIGP